MGYKPFMLSVLPIAMTCDMELDACHDSGKQEQDQQKLHVQPDFLSLVNWWILGVAVGNKEHTVRTGLDALPATDAGASVLECHMLVP